MSDIIFYNNSKPQLAWQHWGAVPPEGEVPPTHVQEVWDDPAALTEEYYARFKEVAAACGRLLQYSIRVALPETALTAVQEHATLSGLDLQLGPARICSPDTPATIHLGYLQLADGPEYPQLSTMRNGLDAGHCLLVRSGATVPKEAVLPDNIRALAGLDLLHYYENHSPQPSWRVASREEGRFRLE